MLDNDAPSFAFVAHPIARLAAGKSRHFVLDKKTEP
jgi:hypothetical protein